MNFFTQQGRALLLALVVVVALVGLSGCAGTTSSEKVRTPNNVEAVKVAKPDMATQVTWMLDKVAKGENLWDLSVEDVKKKIPDATGEFFANFNEFTMPECKLLSNNIDRENWTRLHEQLVDHDRNIGISRFESFVITKDEDKQKLAKITFNLYQNKLYKVGFGTECGGSFNACCGFGKIIEITDSWCNKYSFDSSHLKSTCYRGTYQNRIGEITLVNPTIEKQIYVAQGLMYPTYGYDKVEWGADMQTIQNNYKNSKVFPDDDAAYGKTTLKQIIADGQLIEREFRFYQDKLYFVKVRYNDKVKEAMTEKLLTTFGIEAFDLIRVDQYGNVDFGKMIEAGIKQEEAKDYEKRRKITGEGSASVSLQKNVDAMLEAAKVMSEVQFYTDVSYSSPQKASVLVAIEDAKKNQAEQKQRDERQKKLDGLGY